MDENQKTTINNEQKKIPTWIIVVIVVIVVLLGGVYYGANLIKSKIANSLPVNIDKNGSTYKVKTGSVETVASEKEIPWPAEIPGDLPKFQGGKIKSVSNDVKTGTWVIVIANTTESEFNNYKTYLMNADWETEGELSALVNMTTMVKGGKQASVVFDKSSNGVLITLTTIQK